MRRTVSAVSIVVAVCVPLIGCSVTTSEQTFDESLVQQVGGGSDAVASIVPTLQTSAKAGAAFNDPGANRTALLLAEGQLDRLTPRDIVALQNANRAAARRFPIALRTLDGLTARLVAASIDPSAHRNLSAGAKRFIAAWDSYLQSIAGSLRAVRRAFSGFIPNFGEGQSLVAAALDTANLHSTVKFAKLRRRFLARFKLRSDRAQEVMKAAVTPSAADRHFVSLVNHDQEAQAIVRKVNREYPNGWLAQEFKTS